MNTLSLEKIQYDQRENNAQYVQHVQQQLQSSSNYTVWV